jgi:hypothetical protein
VLFKGGGGINSRENEGVKRQEREDVGSERAKKKKILTARGAVGRAAKGS